MHYRILMLIREKEELKMHRKCTRDKKTKRAIGKEIRKKEKEIKDIARDKQVRLFE